MKIFQPIVSGSFTTSGSVFLKGLTSAAQSNVVLIDTASGQLYTTASSALVGGEIVATASYALTSSYSTNISGSTNYLPKFSGSNSLGNSLIYDNGTNVGIGKTNPTKKLDIAGDILVNDITVGIGGGNDRSNTAVGFQSFFYNTGGQFNTAIGSNALVDNTGGVANTAIGASALNDTYGNNNIGLGYYTRTLSGTDYNSIVIGTNAIGLGPNTTVLGNLQTITTALRGNVGIGTTAPNAKLDVSGSAIISGSLAVTNGITGSLFGTSSWAVSASWAPVQVSGSYALTSSLATNVVGTANRILFNNATNTTTTSNNLTWTDSTNLLTLGDGTGTAGTISKLALYTSSYGGYGLGVSPSQLDYVSDGSHVFYKNGTTPSELVRITNTGNVGIGTTTPATPLHISTDGAAQIRLQHTGYSYWDITSAYNTSNADLYFNNSSGEKFRINASGNVGIGTTAPSYKLDVNGTARVSSGLDVDSYILTRNKLQISNGRLFELIGTSDALNIYDGSAGASRIYISGSGNVGIGTTAPTLGTLQVNGNVYATSFTGSLFGTASWAENATNVTTATNALSASNFTITSTLRLDGSLTDYATVNSTIVGDNNLYTQNTGSYTSAFVKYTVSNGANARAGEFIVNWNGTTVTYFDNSTTDIGSTSDIVFSSAIVTGQVQVNATAASSGWKIKTLATFI